MLRLKSAVRLAALLMAVGSGCRPQETPTDTTFPDIAGRWSYRATDIQGPGITCSIPELILTLSQIPAQGSFTGDATGGKMICTDELGEYTVAIDPHPVENGYTFSKFFAFDLYNADWRHDGLLITPDSMEGQFVLRNGAGTYRGKVTIVRIQER